MSIINILSRHGVRTRLYFGRLQAEDIYSVDRNGIARFGRRWVDITNRSAPWVYGWLGY